MHLGMQKVNHEPAYSTTYRYDLLNPVTTETDPQNRVTYIDYYRLQTTTHLHNPEPPESFGYDALDLLHQDHTN